MHLFVLGRHMYTVMAFVLEEDQSSGSIWVIQRRHYWRSIARFQWKWIPASGVGRRICRRMCDRFREERDRKNNLAIRAINLQNAN